MIEIFYCILLSTAMAVGDALGVPFESAKREHMLNNPVTDSMTENRRKSHHWNHVLKEAGLFSDDTSMALCLAASLIIRHGFDAYDIFVRFKWWTKHK